MDNKKKILLGEKDIISKSNEDLYINLNLNTTFNELKNDKFENVFDVSKQFDKERNTSRDFRIYGIIDATITDCNNLQLSAYSSAYSGTGINSGTTILSGLVKSFSSTDLVYNGYNTYGKKKGKYILELSSYTNDFVYIKIPSNNATYKDQIYVQQLIFKDADGNFVDYGTQTIDITENGNAIEINNDFYFLYNKHWIKKDLSIEEEKQAKVFFSAASLVDTVSESMSANVFFNVVLDKPSPFGLEVVDLGIMNRTLDSPEISVRDQNNNVIPSFPTTLTFQKGEQIKNFSFNSDIDTLQELVEDMTLELTNFKLVNTGSPLTHTIFVVDSTPRNKVKLNFQNIYQNRNYFTGRVGTISSSVFSFPMPAVLRNGLNYEGTPMEFYPIDNFTLKIKNIGINTILPVNSVLGINSEQIFATGQELTFNIDTQYQNTEKHAIKFYFAQEKSNNISNIIASISGASINGIPIVDYYKTYRIDYNNFLSCFKNTADASTNNQNISGWGRYNLDRPFDVIENLSGLTITLVAKNTGTRLDLKSYGNFPNLFDTSDPRLQLLGITAKTIQEFVQTEQIPLEIVLGANINNNSQAQYAFEIIKTGYDRMTFTSSTLNADVVPPSYKLVAGYHDILRNWDNTSNTPVYVHSGVTSNWSNVYNGTGFYTSGEAYVNGILLLANLYFDRTQNTYTYFPGQQSLNSTHFTNASGNFRADFLPASITTVPSTSEILSPQNRKQKGILRIESKHFSVNAPIMDRSFDFRTGFTDAFTTYYHSIDQPGNGNVVTDSVFDNAYGWWNYAGRTFASGNTTNTNTPLLLKAYLQDGYAPLNINSQGLTGLNPIGYPTLALVQSAYNIISSVNNYIELNAPSAGIPFEIKNIKGFRNLDGTKFNNDAIIEYLPILPNEIFGVTINEANNFMKGFSLLHP